MKFLDLDIRTGKFEGDGKTYMAVVNLLIYSTVGMAWWKMLGLW